MNGRNASFGALFDALFDALPQGVAALHPGLPSPPALQAGSESEQLLAFATNAVIGRPLGLHGSVAQMGTTRIRTPLGVRANMLTINLTDFARQYIFNDNFRRSV
jgi:hypothetical protein